jgi:hypothetical protein
VKGQVNVYTCTSCRAQLVTIDRDEGVTPMFMRCNEPPLTSCGGDMRSAFYRPRMPHAPPTHEWYAPTKDELRGLSRSMREHCAQGGLLIRPIAAAVPT